MKVYRAMCKEERDNTIKINLQILRKDLSGLQPILILFTTELRMGNLITQDLRKELMIIF